MSLVVISDDLREVVAALLEVDGNITLAARKLSIDPEAFRAIVRKTPLLSEAVEEAMERGVDEAVGVLFHGLRDEGSFQNRFYAAKEFLRTEAARRRGFGPRERAEASLEVKSGAGQTTLTLRWLSDGETPAEIP